VNRPWNARRLWAWLTAKRIRLLWLPLAGAILISAALAWGETGTAPDGTTLYAPWAGVALVVGGFLVVGALAGLAEAAARQKMTGESRQEQVRILTQSLESALLAVETIKTQIEEGDRALAELEHRMDTSRVLSRLSESEAAAVRDALNTEFRIFSRRSYWRDTAFLVVGAALAYGVDRLFG